jgi:PilZ domain
MVSIMDDPRDEFRLLTQRCNAGTATADEYERWCDLRAELRSTDLPTRRMKDRQWPRAECDLMVELRIGRALRQVRCIDFGPGGLGLEVPESIAVGALAHVRFRLPGDQTSYTANCRVMWFDQERSHCGVRFEGLAQPVQDELQAATLAEHVVAGLHQDDSD